MVDQRTDCRWCCGVTEDDDGDAHKESVSGMDADRLSFCGSGGKGHTAIYKLIARQISVTVEFVLRDREGKCWGSVSFMIFASLHYHHHPRI